MGLAAAPMPGNEAVSGEAVPALCRQSSSRSSHRTAPETPDPPEPPATPQPQSAPWVPVVGVCPVSISSARRPRAAPAQTRELTFQRFQSSKSSAERGGRVIGGLPAWLHVHERRFAPLWRGLRPPPPPRQPQPTLAVPSSSRSAATVPLHPRALWAPSARVTLLAEKKVLRQ